MDDYVVHIVDDDEPVRKSLAFLMTVAGFTVRIHESATSFLALAPTLANACLVTDLRMPDLSGVELLQRLKTARIRIPAIVITGHGDVPMAVEAMRAGALDFIEKPFDDQVLIDAVRRAALEIPANTPSGDVQAIDRCLLELTGREREVLAAVVTGLPNKAIAYDLQISPRTVEVHRSNVMAKMGARSLAELVRMSVAAGVISK